jgi:DNA-binding winged helix-turn-helix (wHTH) protein/Tol biopolymer transport system component
MMADQNVRSCRFDRFTIDPARRQLLRDGAPVPLNSKTFDVLLTLVEHRGELITKEDLLARVWPDQMVEEGNLTVHVSALRKALGERRGEHRYIVTVPGRGYTFVADVRDDAKPPAAAIRPWPRLRKPAVAGIVAFALLFALGFAYRLKGDAWKRSTGGGATGMTSTLVTAVGTVSSAALSPDGQSFAYTVFEGGRYSLWLSRVDGGHPVPLCSAQDVGYEGLAFSSDGAHIFYASRGALFSVPIVGGAPQKRLDGVSASFSVAADGARVAFTRRRPETRTLVIAIAAMDGAGAPREVQAPDGGEFSSFGPAWSPDGTRLAIGVTTPATPGQFMLTSVRVGDGSMQTIDPRAWSSIGRLAWLHDGSGIVFNAVGASSDFHIWLYDEGHRELRCITPDVSRYGRASVSVSNDASSLLAVRSEISSSIWIGQSGEPRQTRPVTSRAFGKLDGSAGLSWTPDGRIVYSSFLNNSYSLWTMTADGTDAKPLTSSGYVDRFPRVVADGRYVVFQSNRGGGEDLWRIDRDGGHLRRLTSGGRHSQPDVTPDGRWVFFVETMNGMTSIWKTSVDGGEPTRVVAAGSWPAVSPDGARLAYGAADNGLAVLSLGDGGPSAHFGVPRGGTFNNGLRWSADGTAVIYRDFSEGLWQQPLAGGPAARLPDAAARRIYFFDWTRDGRRFALAYGDEVRDVVLMRGFR